MKPDLKSCERFTVCLAVLLLFAVCFVPACFAVDAAEARSAIDEAEFGLGSAFVVVAEAEAAGADVSVLLSMLNSGGSSLSEAHVAFRAGDYVAASELAVECSHIIDGVAGDAAGLRADADKARSDGLLLAVVGSSVGLVLLGVFGFLGWRLLKRRYYKRVLDLKPVVEAVQ